MPRRYGFVDEWDVGAPPEVVFGVLADGDSYPRWWRPVYLEVEVDGPARVGQVGRQCFSGVLPYRLRTTSVMTTFEPVRRLAVEVDGDLRGRGSWTLTPSGSGTHVVFEWHVEAVRRLLRYLGPVMAPVFRWNHKWAIARAREGLEREALTGSAAISA